MMPRPGSIVSRGSGRPKAAHCAVTIARSPAASVFTSGASSSGVYAMPNPPPRSSSVDGDAVLGVDPRRQLEHPPGGHLEAGGVEDLRADVRVQPGELEHGQRQHPADRLVGGAGREREAELLVVVRGRHELVGVRLDPGRHPDQDPRPGAGQVGVVGEPGDLLEGVDHDVPDPGRHRLLDLGGQLVVAVQRDQRRVHPGGQRHRQLAAGAHVHAEALFGHPAEHRARAERLGRVGDVRVRPERLHVLAGPAAHVRLVGDEHRGAELGWPGRARPRRRASAPRPAARRRAARSPRPARSGRRAAPAGGRLAARPRAWARPGGRHDSLRFPHSQRRNFTAGRARRLPSSPSPAARPVRAALAMASLSVPRRPGAFPGSPAQIKAAMAALASSSRYRANSSGRPRRAAVATRSGSHDSASSSTNSPGSAGGCRGTARLPSGIVREVAAQRTPDAARACAYLTA